jgi:hypothetical protein
VLEPPDRTPRGLKPPDYTWPRRLYAAPPPPGAAAAHRHYASTTHTPTPHTHTHTPHTHTYTPHSHTLRRTRTPARRTHTHLRHTCSLRRRRPPRAQRRQCGAPAGLSGVAAPAGGRDARRRIRSRRHADVTRSPDGGPEPGPARDEGPCRLRRIEVQGTGRGVRVRGACTGCVYGVPRGPIQFASP